MRNIVQTVLKTSILQESDDSLILESCKSSHQDYVDSSIPSTTESASSSFQTEFNLTKHNASTALMILSEKISLKTNL